MEAEFVVEVVAAAEVTVSGDFLLIITVIAIIVSSAKIIIKWT